MKFATTLKKVITAATKYILLSMIATYFFGFTTTLSATETNKGASEKERPVILTQFEGQIRVVYQISRDEWRDGVGKGLLYLDKLYDQYIKEGIDPERLEIHAVFHGTAAEHLLTDEAWNRYKDAKEGNPNTELLTRLKKKHINVELCNTRRLANGWEAAEINQTVDLVNGAFQRVIDLQLMGFAYVRF